MPWLSWLFETSQFLKISLMIGQWFSGLTLCVRTAYCFEDPRSSSHHPPVSSPHTRSRSRLPLTQPSQRPHSGSRLDWSGSSTQVPSAVPIFEPPLRQPISIFVLRNQLLTHNPTTWYQGWVGVHYLVPASYSQL